MTTPPARPRAQQRWGGPLLILGLALGLALPLPAQEAPLLLRAPDRYVELSTEAFAALPHDTATITFRDSVYHYEGVPVHALLSLVGVRADSMRGRSVQLRVVVEAADGYEVVLSLAECDPTLPDRRVLLADQVNGGPLPPGEAPRRLLIVGDPRHARWARQVVALAVRDEAPESQSVAH